MKNDITSLISGEIERAEERLKLVRENSLEKYRAGFLTPEERERRELSSLAGQSTALRELARVRCREAGLAWDAAAWRSVETRLAAAAGRTLEPGPPPGEREANRLMDGGLYIFRDRLAGFEPLFYEEAPAGKSFDLRLTLEDRGELREMAYTFRAESFSSSPAEEGVEKEYKGFGALPGYSGEAAIRIRKMPDRFRTVVYQKTYMDQADPVRRGTGDRFR